MMKVFLLTFACMMCTISMAWGCVSGAGPAWELSQPARPGPGHRKGSGWGAARPAARVAAKVHRPSRPSIPIEVARYFAGRISKESAFASIDHDGNGLVSIQEWTLIGGARTEFNYMLVRLDANGDNLISLPELQPFSLPITNRQRDF
ncbi:uncharacterized protein LOC753317 [Strongylocentrotus purpuratus]|uniref:EF-hand domain-containing protein n=1 Tax=Strongylocentrotus purpuratus TaxID=7668 RepID=A0A7M7PJG5_STRPU|nr:uncharacterized protein LOC753317 [Strongylocentrotus purpuratus]